ncbi:MAG TPA: IucA/IucC family protein [Stenotrophomonas sp.]|nr:IucA/IucC family protein [Stenotrophomonas sp.]
MNHPSDERYIVTRIIDACLREDVRCIASKGIVAEPGPALLSAWPEAAVPAVWLRIDHLPDGIVWLPVRREGYLQEVSACHDYWLVQQGGQVLSEHGAGPWLARLGSGLDEEAQRLHRAYAEEAACAIGHRGAARQGYAEQAPLLANALRLPDAAERAYRCDQVASYRDHPFYPTARAKLGLTDEQLRRFAPEFGASFALRWLAVPRSQATCTSAAPALWPEPATLGLPASVAESHLLWPVHPMLWDQLGQDDFPLPDGSLRAPREWLQVRPTLSVRSLACMQAPGFHIKVPVPMRTLGALNLRLMKPSTLYDGHWMERVLRMIAHLDPILGTCCVPVDEAHGGHVGEASHLTYLVRRYPELPDATLVPAAAFCAAMPDGRPMAAHLADQFHGGDLVAWWDDYTALLCRVHLRLWLRYGIALEANQQNCVVIYSAGHATRLLMKDNDSARIRLPRLRAQLPGLDVLGTPRDPRLLVDEEAWLARMFCTIVLQLDLQAILEGLSAGQPELRARLYARLRLQLAQVLQQLDDEAIDTAPARQLLSADRLPVKYLLSAGSLLSKRHTGALDINKYYGDSAPNPFGGGFSRNASPARP